MSEVERKWYESAVVHEGIVLCHYTEKARMYLTSQIKPFIKVQAKKF